MELLLINEMEKYVDTVDFRMWLKGEHCQIQLELPFMCVKELLYFSLFSSITLNCGLRDEHNIFNRAEYFVTFIQNLNPLW